MSDDASESHSVTLTLLDISKQVADDADATRIVRLVQDEVLAAPCHAQSFLHNKNNESTTSSSSSEDDIAFIQKQVVRFLQTKDKYTALGSTLLKSQAFHVAYKTTPPNRTVVELPRTEHKKPYIPITMSADCDPSIAYSSIKGEEEEHDVFPVSVSHQFPYVGAVRLDTSNDCTSQPRPHLGMDLVTFDDYNRKLYKSRDDFLNVFQGSFTEREWSVIQSETEWRLQDFYIRWAMKEAYTKALGLGMGIEFDSFDLRLSSNDSGLWQAISANPQGIYFCGSVTHLGGETPPQLWDFFFLPIYENELPKGCVCICIGPLPSPLDPSSRFRTQVQWTDLDGLIKWHFQPKETY